MFMPHVVDLHIYWGMFGLLALVGIVSSAAVSIGTLCPCFQLKFFLQVR